MKEIKSHTVCLGDHKHNLDEIPRSKGFQCDIGYRLLSSQKTLAQHKCKTVPKSREPTSQNRLNGLSLITIHRDQDYDEIWTYFPGCIRAGCSFRIIYYPEHDVMWWYYSSISGDSVIGYACWIFSTPDTGWRRGNTRVECATSKLAKTAAFDYLSNNLVIRPVIRAMKKQIEDLTKRVMELVSFKIVSQTVTKTLRKEIDPLDQYGRWHSVVIWLFGKTKFVSLIILCI